MKHQIQFFFIDCFMKYAKRGNNFCWNNFFVRVIVDFSLKKFMVLEWLVYIYNKETEVCAGNKFPQSGPLPTTSVTWEMIFFSRSIVNYSQNSIFFSIQRIHQWFRLLVLKRLLLFFFPSSVMKKSSFSSIKNNCFWQKKVL